MKLAFTKEYVESVLNGDKTATVRKGWADGIPAGNTVRAVTSENKTFTEVEIQRKIECRVIEAIDFIEYFDAEYGSSTVTSLIDGLEKHYDHVEPMTRVTVYVFKNNDRRN